jgi:hypothetical protein
MPHQLIALVMLVIFLGHICVKNDWSIMITTNFVHCRMWLEND